MPERPITLGERTLLYPIFHWTLPYDDQWVETNDSNIGGSDNSITPLGVPHMSNEIWSPDYNIAPDNYKYTFIHEMTHVWQHFHGINVLAEAAYLMTQYGSDYDPKAYRYDLSSHGNFRNFNIEQQASIVADYWYLSKGNSPRYNIGADRSQSSYAAKIGEVQNAGEPSQWAVVAQDVLIAQRIISFL